ncbi:aldehyde dehydrogenase family protein [Nitratireductor sp. ZSWI3]|uniref:aldehyde dehydrogenase family protein n=1 Tax=Nitratireductor sp. ZSWI3 TaxID=2966359 RepID=UPI00214FFCB2|nr:aldehyde dehydrogenase family protein [Nitratireductor sp. ZSWI3]MCR4265833.1 aldehyde dehydrogenase family protein [Nitratireductor sp. ZSWI3]
MLIDGRWCDAVSGETFVRASPGNSREVGNYPKAGVADVDMAVGAAREAFDTGGWRRMPGVERAGILAATANLMREHADELALFETLESGKTITSARREIFASADIWNYCAGLARTLHGEAHSNLGDNLLAAILREPVGVVSIVTPWNFPVLVVSQKLPFALAAGCTVVLKPSEFTSATTLMIAELVQEAGLPNGVLNVLTGFGDPVGQRMLDHPDVDMISFTGSTRVGKVAIAASAAHIKKVSLELGGKNAQVVFADADLEDAADAVVEGAFKNAGENCNCGARILVERSVFDRFIGRVKELASQVRVGDPLDPQTQVGAIIHEQHLDKICAFVDRAERDGARIHLGKGRLRSEAGYYAQPCLVTGVDNNAPIANEEVFGPVAVAMPFDSDDEALRIANQTEYGLSASVWTSDYERAMRFGRELQAGTVWVNTYLSGPPELPFGGCKQSGLGRENGKAGIEEFTEIKTVQFQTGPRQGRWFPRP